MEQNYASIEIPEEGGSSVRATERASMVKNRINDELYKLYEPSDGLPYDTEIIFVHDLYTEGCEDAWITTWTNEYGKCWPREFLAEDFPRARMLSVSYDACVTTTSTQGRMDSLSLLADNLMVSFFLESSNVGQTYHCPILFVGHGLGCFVIKKLMIKVCEFYKGEREKKDKFLSNVGGFVFYSPFNSGVKWNMFENESGQSNSLMYNLRPHHPELSRLNESFSKLRRDMQYRQHSAYPSTKQEYLWTVVTICESDRTASKTRMPRVLQRCQTFVSEGTARYDCDSFWFGAGDHFTVCRPRSRKEVGYLLVKEFLEKVQKSNKSSRPYDDLLPNINRKNLRPPGSGPTINKINGNKCTKDSPEAIEANYLVHGTLHVTIYEADGLVNEQRLSGRAPRIFRKFVETIEEATGFWTCTSRLYATVRLGKTRVGRTRIIKKESRRPVWNDSLRIYAAHSVPDVVISVKNDILIGSTVIGRAKVPVSEVISGRIIDGWFYLYHDNGDPVKGGKAQVRFRMQYFAAVDDECWGRGINSPDYEGVPYTFFPQRKGCRVRLYQDAHMADNFLPPITLEDGQREPTRCWEDAYSMIMGAKHLIYITGWSVSTEIKLIRDEDRMIEGAEGVSLGELLKRKAAEGVHVKLLVWDDKNYRDRGFLTRESLRTAHGMDTANFFKNTDVKFFLCPRFTAEGREFRIDKNTFPLIDVLKYGVRYTHNQNTLIVDAPVPGRKKDGKRRILSMVGGIDLCHGRYDTQHHPLFRTLATVNNDDFHQPNFEDATIDHGGPREPWHDIHAQVEGPVAWDILHNFQQRWLKQEGREKPERLVCPEFSRLDIHQPSIVTEEDDPETWNVQLFRSIDNYAVDFPEAPDEAGLSDVMCSVVDRSIQDAYINAIRRAKDYIYIENEYFLGSSFGWDDKREVKASHLIPMELALKIVSKIEGGERFAVYVVTPMWPEGDPKSGEVQATLSMMHRTLQMMYKLIAQALNAAGSDKSPRDYLNFYCLGNREAYMDGELEPTCEPDLGPDHEFAQTNRRFMIYVHSKMMIVDDEYVIVGSANINERSMNGFRESEIAIGAYQPHRLLNRNGFPHGQVHGFRMSLWFEHMGRIENCFSSPQSLECVQTVNSIADELWASYMQKEPVDMKGHLLPFPIAVTHEGDVTELPGMTCFPDTQAPILGGLQEFEKGPAPKFCALMSV